MNLEILRDDLIRKCTHLGITLVGFAPIGRWKNPPGELPNVLSPWIPEDFWPQSIYPEAKTVIVIGLPVSLPIVETAPSIYYHELYKNQRYMHSLPSMCEKLPCWGHSGKRDFSSHGR